MANEIGKLIRQALRDHKKTQRWLADEMGVSDNAVAKWIKTGQVGKDKIPALAQTLGLLISDFYPGTEFQYPTLDDFDREALRVMQEFRTPEQKAEAIKNLESLAALFAKFEPRKN